MKREKKIKYRTKSKPQNLMQRICIAICGNKTKRITAYMSSVLLILIAVAIFVSADFLVRAGYSHIDKNNQKAADVESEKMKEIQKERDAEKEEVLANAETIEEKIERVRKEAKAAGYPEDIIGMLDKNDETVDFVAAYGEKKNTKAPADLGDSYVEGEFPQVLQWDSRWGYMSYGPSGHISSCGCGPTSLSMVIAGLNKDKTVTPAVVAAYSDEKSMVDDNNSTYWSLMTTGAKHWGITGVKMSTDEKQVKEQLQKGHPVICSMRPGDFTKNGHFILMIAYDNGMVKVNDPFSQINSDKLWKYSEIKSQIKAAWYFYKK